MTQVKNALNIVDQNTVINTNYDVIIVGAGICGAIAAKELAAEGKQVLILEAGTYEGATLRGFQSYVDQFYGALAKHSNAPYPENWNSASPTDDVEYPYQYFVEKGELQLSGSYTRVLGGTTMHWEGKMLRMLPDDYQSHTNYGFGYDWPIGQDEMLPYYIKAEVETGVAGNTAQQEALGIKFSQEQDNPKYALPMNELPPSWLDTLMAEKLTGESYTFGNQACSLDLSTFPQARNAVPNPQYTEYNGGKAFVPQGIAAEMSIQYGERCQGNANCVSICPVQAKYDARKTLNSIANSEYVHILPQAVACQVETNASGEVTSIRYKLYKNTGEGEAQFTEYAVSGKLYVLAANAIENAKLMLASNLQSTSKLIGKNLMDHPFLLAWGLMPDVAGAMRGPLVTSGIGGFRKGDFRKDQAAFGIDIHNDGWGWAGTSVSDLVNEAIDKGSYGNALQQRIIDTASRQVLLAFMCEIPPLESNYLTIDESYKDQLGNYRPVIHYDIPDYCKKTFKDARQLSKHIFELADIEDKTDYSTNDPFRFKYEDEMYIYRGGNHFSGTHIMGTSKDNSVVDSYMRNHDISNLFMVGAGSLPTIGTSNTTLSIAALTYRATEAMLGDLNPA